jgi:hypothetical protein
VKKTLFIPGNINQFLKILSLSQDKVEAQLNKVLANSSHQPKISAADDELNEFSDYWQYFDDGVELLWGLGRLRSVAVYTQQSDKEGYLPYTDQLFSTFSNMAHKNTVEEYLGSPSKTGNWFNNTWIRYDDVNTADIAMRFEFDTTERIARIGITEKSAMRR